MCMNSFRIGGFSLVEIVVSVAILALLTILVFIIQVRSLWPEQALVTGADSTRSMLVLARSYALNGKLCCGNQLPNGYGLVIALDGQPDNTISLYADLDSTNTYTPSDAIVSDVVLANPVDVVSCQDTATTVSATGTCDLLFSATGGRNIYFGGNALSGTFSITLNNYNITNQLSTINVYGFGIIE